MARSCDGAAHDVPAIVELAWLGARAGRMLSEFHGEIGLSPRHLQTLLMLRTTNGCTQQELARLVGVDPTKLVGVLNELEARRLVRRVRDTQDRRRHNVHLTAAGDRRLTASLRRVDALDEALLAGFTDAQRTHLRDLLRAGRRSTGAPGECP